MNARWHGLLRWRLGAAGLAFVVGFAVLAGRFWHPHYGFTRFIQLDEADRRDGIHELCEYPIFWYPGFNGYDGAAYAQIAFHPWLDSSELKPALGNLPYRARRILASALTWLLAAGDPARIAATYAALNLGVWLLGAVLLWRILPVVDARGLALWAGWMFSAGALHSVRLALTDLLAATLVTTAVWCSEKGRSRTALAILAAAGLARETALTAVVALWRGPWNDPRRWYRQAGQAVLAALPLLGWIIYVRWKAGAADQGFGNFTWPIIGWMEKWSEIATDFSRHPEFRMLVGSTLLATIALTVQAAYLLRRPRVDDPWWRLGLAAIVLMGMLGTSVWEGQPGAATRVLLPMGAAFAVLAVRDRASWLWVLGGSLTVFSGVLALWEVPPAAREIGAGRLRGGSYVATIEEGWYGLERQRGATWSWSANRGTLLVETAPRTAAVQQVRLKVRAMTPRDFEVRQGATTIYRGRLTVQSQWITLPVEAAPAPGRLLLELRAMGEPVRENDQPEARALGFALQGVEVK